MAIVVALNHVTSYTYDRWVALSPQVVRLRPAPHCRTPIRSYSLRLTPERHFLNWQQDPQGNYLARAVFPDTTRALRVEVDLVAELAVYNPFDFFLEPSAEQFPFAYEPDVAIDLAPYLRAESLTPRFTGYLRAVSLTPRRTLDFLVELNQRVQRDVAYVIRPEPGVQTKEETLALGRGSCRDSAWLLVQLLRHLGLAARFVSGYLIQLVPDVAPVGGPAGPTADFVDLHAWAEVYLPGAGWIGLDPTSGLLAGEGHVPLACTPDPASAAPLSGAVDECEATFEHAMSVARIEETPRVTRPYTAGQWQAVLELGQTVDGDLKRMDVRLTMGGEPTFVAEADRDGAEWNTAALGPTKRRFAAALLHRLRARYGASGFVHVGQGKWYPGEQLPRWALACHWRRDGEPAWRDPALFADESAPAGHGSADAARFVRALAVRLGVSATHAQAGYEDVWYYLWRERRLPVNVDPFDARLDDEMERDRLRRVFSQGLDHIVGYALPLERDAVAGRWKSGAWLLRDERMYLAPGDSAMGYRLPLDSLPWASEGDRPLALERDPLEPRPALPPYDAIRAQVEPLMQTPGVPGADQAVASDGTVLGAPAVPPGDAAHGAGPIDSPLGARAGRHGGAGTADRDDAPPARGESAGARVRTALCVEPRDGTLYVFMPPIPVLEDYLGLVAAIEATAAALGTRVLIEGYPPPSDPRLVSFMITPDPGVVEVNVQPSATWDDLVDLTTTVYEEARQVGLTTDKFMLDGRHTGTGGGNHLVLGGPTAADSPFLRRPDLLGSLIRYWHNHPSLSYLFSGLFLGPTSQAPRVDEARNDSLYELEIALRLLPPPQAPTAPWLVDRLFRHLLVDVTGNTHRAELCIDKLYSPDTAGGRRGLLEMRAFEMPPHARMSLVQQLLVRALVAAFWREPYEARLARWDTALHDRFMLPYFVWLDFEDVLQELRCAGYPLEPAWFQPHLELRFPRCGEVTARAVRLSLRQALEPWHVLGEEGTAGGTARYVDSSVERLEVLVQGLTEARHVVTCNGRAVPLHPTGRRGEFVAGVRYRAWQPPSALHPTIAVHAPLTFDVVDTWLERSLGGCRYHVSHPGGRSYDRLPVNGAEAEARRRGRFTALGHTPGKVLAAEAIRSREFPYTLDLRT